MEPTFPPAYVSALQTATDAMRQWIADKKLTDLPEDPYDLPKDCPLFGLGLSFAQASAINGSLRRELAGGPKATV